MKSLKLPEDLRIQAAATLRDRLLVALDGTGALRLQGGDVARLDTAGLQLLVAAAAEAKCRGRELHLVAPAKSLKEGLRRLGLDELSPPKANKARARRVSKVKANG